MRILDLSGEPDAMGESFGEACRDEIASLYACRLENARRQAKLYGGRDPSEEDVLALARACLAPTEVFDPDGFAELRGIARGAALSPEHVLAMNGLTDLRDVLAWGADLESLGGCTSLIVQRDASADDQVLCGQTWDLETDNMPFVVGVHRRPSRGPETWCVTTVGCLSLIGMNARGIAIGTTNLRTLDARPGVPYLSVIHRALACGTHEEAVAAIRAAVRAGGHSYYVVDREGQAVLVECTATRSRVLPLTSGSHVHTNHCQVREHADLEADTPKASSRARLDRMRELLRKREGRHDVGSLRACLADQEGGALAICRDDIAGISTNAAIVMSPEEPALWACHGLPSRGRWVDLLRGSSA